LLQSEIFFEKEKEKEKENSTGIVSPDPANLHAEIIQAFRNFFLSQKKKFKKNFYKKTKKKSKPVLFATIRKIFD